MALNLPLVSCCVVSGREWTLYTCEIARPTLDKPSWWRSCDLTFVIRQTHQPCNGRVGALRGCRPRPLVGEIGPQLEGSYALLHQHPQPDLLRGFDGQGSDTAKGPLQVAVLQRGGTQHPRQAGVQFWVGEPAPVDLVNLAKP
eukprot:6621743-Pyramimonas_sp.AAC.3